VTHAETERPLVLVVEDDLGHARIIERAFEDTASAQLRLVHDLKAARAAIAARPPQVLIADLVLPDGRGVELIVDPETAAYPVIIMTSQGDERVAVESLKTGALDYIVKSSDTLLNLSQIATRALREWNLRLQKREAEQALARSEARNRAILDAVPDLILIHDAQGKVVACEGGRATSMLQDRGHLAGMEIQQLLTPESAPSVLEVIQAVLQDGEPQMALYHVAGGETPRVLEGRLVRYAADQVLSLLHDITDRHHASAQLKRLSPREQDVLGLIMEGETNKAIGGRLGIGVKTVETHRANMMKKLKARTVADLLRIAYAADSK
jgi:PAS domain S-box-containing protein